MFSWSNKNIPGRTANIVLSMLSGIACSFISCEVQADIVTGKDWLIRSSNTKSQIANPLQTQQEVATILNHLQTGVTLEQVTINVDNEVSTEGLVRLILC